MNYTIKISENDNESARIISMIKEMAGNNPNIGIYEDETGLSGEMEVELERRYQIVLKNPKEGRPWDQVKSDLLNR